MFWKSREKEQEISKIEKQVELIALKMEAFEQNMRSLRGLVNRKLGYFTPEEEEEQEVIEKEKVKYTDGFDMFRI